MMKNFLLWLFGKIMKLEEIEIPDERLEILNYV